MNTPLAIAATTPRFRDEVLAVGPFRTRCLLAGADDLPPLVLLHDGAWGGCSSVTWGDVIPRLAGHYRVIAPDLLGFGGTAKAVFLDRSPYDFRGDHVIALLDLLGIPGRVHVVGSSFGGSLAVQMIPPHAGRLASVATISGTGGPWRSDFGRAELARWDGSRQDIGRIVGLLADERPGFDPAVQVAERFRWASAPGHYRAMAAPGLALPEGLSSGLAADAAWPGPLARHQVPVLAVAGARDRLVEPGWAERLIAPVARGRSLTLDCRHSPNIDDPAGTAALLLDWLASVG